MESHDRQMHTVRLSDEKRLRYRCAIGAEKLRLHFDIFYNPLSALQVVGPQHPATLLHPLLIGSIPLGAAINEARYGNRADAAMPKRMDFDVVSVAEEKQSWILFLLQEQGKWRIYATQIEGRMHDLDMEARLRFGR